MAGGEKRTFVLVHGAWHGGWCWRRVADILEGQGHTVLAPTLTGLGARSHLLAPGITLSTHIADIVGEMKWECAENVVLCGHSYGGMIITGVADEMREAIGSIVFLDAFVPESGDSLYERGNPRVRERIKAAMDSGAPGISPPPAAFFNVNESDRAWVDSLCTPQPTATFADPLHHNGAREKIARKTYIRATDYTNPVFDAARDRLRGDKSWRVIDMACGHDVMVDAPQELAKILVEVA